jgi:hypothetical protein
MEVPKHAFWRLNVFEGASICVLLLENVYAFVRANQIVIVRHKTKRHVCGQPLVFQANVKI